MNKILKINKDKFKQIFLMCLAVFLIGIGYLNYNLEIFEENEVVEVSSSYNEASLGDVELVNSDIVPNDELKENNTVTNLVTNIITNDTSIANTSTVNSDNDEDDYFTETKLERNKMYSEMIEVYQNLIESEETATEQKTVATQEITNITNTKNSIMIAENLIKNKGFEDVVILVNSETVNVVVKSAQLNKEQISQIQNIVQRELSTEFSNISITNK